MTTRHNLYHFDSILGAKVNSDANSYNDVFNEVDIDYEQFEDPKYKENIGGKFGFVNNFAQYPNDSHKLDFIEETAFKNAPTKHTWNRNETMNFYSGDIRNREEDLFFSENVSSATFNIPSTTSNLYTDIFSPVFSISESTPASAHTTNHTPSDRIVLNRIPMDQNPNFIRDLCKSYGEVGYIEFNQSRGYGSTVVQWADKKCAKLAYSKLRSDFLDLTGCHIEVSYLPSGSANFVFIKTVGQENGSINYNIEFHRLLEEKLMVVGKIISMDVLNIKEKLFRCQYSNFNAVKEAISRYDMDSIQGIKIHLFAENVSDQCFQNSERKHIDNLNTELPVGGISQYPEKDNALLSYDLTEIRNLDRNSNKPKYKSHNYTQQVSNVVDIDKIISGLDSRLTLMIRNIPNKIDQQMLKSYIDVSNKNTYDFLYLRMDFLNHCNVGYAFISFTSPSHIVSFCKARVGTKWNLFNSEKVCGISYANIQGTAELIEKFRNSNVMEQSEYT